MLRALFSGVSGLKAHQTKMDVIGNNIANVNTYGYKSQRVTFKDSFYETLSSSSDASDVVGGGNPSQVGYGAILNTIDVLHTRGGYVPTGQPMDVFIQGEGYLVARDAQGNESYTRVGNLKFDGNGNLVDGNKRYICGYPLSRYEASGEAKAAGTELGKFKIDFGANNGAFFNGYKIKFAESTANPAPTDSKAEMNIGDKTITVTTPPGGLAGLTDANLTTLFTGMTVTNGNLPDSIKLADIKATEVAGGAAITDGQLTPGATGGEAAHNKGDVIFTTIPPVSSVLTSGDLKINFGNENGAYFNGFQIKTQQDVNHSPAGTVKATYNIATKTISITTDKADITKQELEDALKAMEAVDGGAVVSSKIDLSLITVNGDATAKMATGITTTKAINGTDIRQSTTIDKTHGLQPLKKPGTLMDTNEDGIYDSEVNDVMNMKGIQIGENGIITGQDDNGNIIQLGQIILANISNPEALTLDGNSYMNAMSNTGEITYTAPGDGTAGSLKAGGLENSNVDLANEFADMIMTQRGFQANSRIITVGDEMLQELVNLKR